MVEATVEEAVVAGSTIEFDRFDRDFAREAPWLAECVPVDYPTPAR